MSGFPQESDSEAPAPKKEARSTCKTSRANPILSPRRLRKARLRTNRETIKPFLRRRRKRGTRNP
eukprot:6749251-Heterocapsa_arctica.AAC.1